MAEIKIIVDPGSCHMAKKEYCKELIDLAVENKCWAIKFQLFKNLPPNIELPRDWWIELVEYCKNRIIIFASVFDMDAFNRMVKLNTPYIKIAYSQRKKWTLRGENVIVSCPPLEVYDYPDCIRLFCIPEYPVLYKIDFDQIFTRYPFEGFSDHTLGYNQTFEAIRKGAKIIEKHITLDHDDIKCPDHYFALRPNELKEMMEAIKGIDKPSVSEMGPGWFGI